MNKIQKLFVVLANPKSDERRYSLTTDLCKAYIETCKKNGLDVDLVDLYKDTQEGEFNPLFYPLEKDTKVIEYQIRIKKSDLLVFFYPAWWSSMPAVMKGFVEKVFVQGFAFQSFKTRDEGLLDEKLAQIFVFDEKSKVESKMFQNNGLSVFWERGLFRTTGMQGRVRVFGGLENFTEDKFKKIEDKIRKLADGINGKKTSLIDLI